MTEFEEIKQDLERLEEYDETLKTRCGNCYYRGGKSCTITKSPLSIETLIKCIEADRFRATNAFHKVLEEKDLLEQVWNKEEWCKGIPLSAESLKSLFNYNKELFEENLALDKKKLELEKENQILKQSVKDTYDTSQEIIADLKDEKQKLKKALDKACKILDWDCPVSQDLIADLDCENRCSDDFEECCRECWKIYFLKEGLKDEH